MRVVRGVAGRRAFQVALLVGGVFALGLLCGERAQAAEGVSSVSVAEAEPWVAEPEPWVAEPEPWVAEPESSLAEPKLSLAEAAASATPESVPPIGESAGSVAGAEDGEPAAPGDGLDEEGQRLDGLGGLRHEAVPSTALPTLSALPALPALSVLPALPSIPEALPAATAIDSPRSGSVRTAASDAGAVGHPTGVTVAHGPRLPLVLACTIRHGAPDHRSAPAAPAAHAVTPTPLRQAPAGEPDGSLGNRVVAEGGSSRYGGASAVAPDLRAPLRLVPGVAAHVDADEIRDRYRDIPVSPA